MVSADEVQQTQPKRKVTGYFLFLLVLALLVGNFLTWRQVGPAQRELRKAQRFLDQQLNINALRDRRASTRDTAQQAITAFVSNGMSRELCDAMTAAEEEIFYAEEVRTNSISLFSTDDNQSLVIKVTLFSTSESVDGPEPQVVEVPLSANTLHQLQLKRGNPDSRFVITLDDKEVLAQALAKFDDAKLELTGSVRLLATPGISADELDDYANVYRDRRWKTLLVRTYAYHRTVDTEKTSQFVAVTVGVKSKGDLYVPQRFHASAARTVKMVWDGEKAHYRIIGVREK